MGGGVQRYSVQEYLALHDLILWLMRHAEPDMPTP